MPVHNHIIGYEKRAELPPPFMIITIMMVTGL